jgi:hypothetical protein
VVGQFDDFVGTLNVFFTRDVGEMWGLRATIDLHLREMKGLRKQDSNKLQ